MHGLQQAMSFSTYYLGLPASEFETFQSDREVYDLMRTLWHTGDGAWTAGDEFPRRDLLEIASDVGLEETVLDRMLALVASAGGRNPRILEQRAYIENTHDFHEALLRSHLRVRGVSDPRGLAEVAIFGASDGDDPDDDVDYGLSLVPADMARQVGSSLDGVERQAR